MRIALIGQAPFGAAVYEKLRENGHTVVGVFTPPEREGGRPDALADAARCFAEAGEIDSALEAFARVETEAPAYFLPEHIGAQLRELRAARRLN